MKNGKSAAANAANQVNPNKGTTGVNRAYAKAVGNRGNQMNPQVEK